MAYSDIPLELRQLNQWVCWRIEFTDTGKPTKVPYNPVNGRHASHADPTTWSSFEEVTALVGKYDGIGFVFGYADPYCGVDLDIKEDTDDETKQRQYKIFQALDSYTEVSPSGMGYHIIVKANVKHGRKRLSVEVYSNLRYFTFTGNVYEGKDTIHERQDIINVLWDEMGSQSENESVYAGKPTQSTEDDALFTQMCGAQNGDLFLKLWQGDLSAHNGDHSRADQALMNFLAYHSGHIPQMVRMFRQSVLGQREKAMRDKYLEYTYKKAFDLTLPTIDLSGIIENFNKVASSAEILPSASEQQPGAGHVFADRDAAPGSHIVDGYDLDLWRRVDPPYAMKLIMEYTMASAPYPVREMGIGAALALMAGLCGRAYNVSNTGLNLYIMVVAATGRGKDAPGAAIEQIFNAVANDAEFPSIFDFAGPRTAASGSGLERYLSEMPVPSCLTVTGEIGFKLKRMSSENANPAEEQLKATLLELYTKSRHGAMHRPQVHADKKNNIEGIKAPAFTWLGESVPSIFYQSLTEAHISEGLIPRFLIIDYLGKRVDYNEDHALVKVGQTLVLTIKSVAETAIKLNQQDKVCTVPFTTDGATEAQRIRIYADKQMNANADEVILNLWNRHHLKVMKVAALLAISRHNLEPVISAEDILWANSLCMTDVINLMGKFERGEIGREGEAKTFDAEQIAHVTKVIGRFIKQEILRDVTSQFHWNNRCITRSMIMKHCLSFKAFTKSNSEGAVRALDKVLVEMVKSGWLEKMNMDQTWSTFKSKAETYAISNAVPFM